MNGQLLQRQKFDSLEGIHRCVANVVDRPQGAERSVRYLEQVQKKLGRNCEIIRFVHGRFP